MNGAFVDCRRAETIHNIQANIKVNQYVLRKDEGSGL